MINYYRRENSDNLKDKSNQIQKNCKFIIEFKYVFNLINNFLPERK